MGEKEDNHQDDYQSIVEDLVDKEIIEKKPPNDKVLYYRIAEDDSKKK